MNESFTEMFTVGGKSNSLGRTNEVIDLVLHDQSRLEKLYLCIFNEDAWVRMRAIDAMEKVCRQHAEWLLPYIDRFAAELHTVSQPSIQWHLAQMYSQVDLTTEQRTIVISWLKQTIKSAEADWIVAANCMDTLMQFMKAGYISKIDLIPLLQVQKQHKSNAVTKRANKYLSEIAGQ